MSLESAPDDRAPQQLGDAYWEALFEQEESVTSPPVTPEKEEAWPELKLHRDGRSPSTDGSNSNQQDPWQAVRTCYEADETLELRVLDYNKGGLLVRWHGIQGFVPASQLLDFPQFHLEAERTRVLKQWCDKQLKLKIIEVNEEANRLILSERAALVDAQQREELFDEIRPHDEVEGRVTNLTDFGAFVDLGGVEGLIHISQLSWSRVTHPSDVVQPGQQITVRVLDVDRHNERIALSLKQLEPNPWETVEERYRPGQLVEGRVSNVVSFGAFVLLETDLEGLIHISELAEGTFLHPRNVVRKGDKVVARVLNVDGRAKRLALSLRGVNNPIDETGDKGTGNA
jgi:small subunit ribosomal protein S1